VTDLLGAVAAATASVSRLYPTNSVPASPTYPYGSYSASLGRGDTFGLDESEGVRWGRIVAQTFGKTLASALAKAEEFRAAVVGVALDIDGYDATPIRSELDPAVVRDPDNAGIVAVTTTYTFTATEEGS
jgi:hypothetical protein